MSLCPLGLRRASLGSPVPVEQVKPNLKASTVRSRLEFATALLGGLFAMSGTRPPSVTINAPNALPAVHIARGGQHVASQVRARRQQLTTQT